MDLQAERKALVEAEYNTYSPDAFPGSPRWMKNFNARKALEAFDAAHPEVLAALKAAPKVEPAYASDSGSHYNRAMRGAD